MSANVYFIFFSDLKYIFYILWGNFMLWLRLQSKLKPNGLKFHTKLCLSLLTQIWHNSFTTNTFSFKVFLCIDLFFLNKALWGGTKQDFQICISMCSIKTNGIHCSLASFFFFCGKKNRFLFLAKACQIFNRRKPKKFNLHVVLLSSGLPVSFQWRIFWHQGL